MNRSRPKAKRSRALGMPLTPKCVRYFERRPYPPGVHGRGRKQQSDYKTRLLEKQRLRAQYDVSERHLRRTFDRATRAAGKTGEALLADLETRLDALVLRSGLARTIYQARQFVSHRHIQVDGRRVNIPSYRVRPGSVITVADKSRKMTPFLEAAAGAHAPEHVPAYLRADHTALVAQLVRLPERHEIPVRCDEQLVVEYYSR
ncbi:30S ribosomal protein S4 [Actinomadura sp. DC4]|uniref:30S ribosomal protein S4 n=1 Tax=Actinomadura sp. DC4 TaxID=3055069 RepID=UPI0025B07FD7|nr:30S ribosomal protein S4 [Actinomadura sp. DC4]MDN3358779.1 30S ribosomal protein S4 [Actinomadura sp. DC4]